MTATDQILAFARFMLADPDERIPLLKGLEINGQFAYYNPALGAEDVNPGLELSNVLRRARNLRRLQIQYCESLFASYPYIGQAIASLPSLDYLCFEWGSHHTERVLSKLTSRPRHLELHDMQAPDPSNPYGSSIFLNLCHSLEDLKLLACASILRRCESEITFPRVHTLSLTGDFELHQIPQLFPNVRSVTCSAHTLATRLRWGNTVVRWPDLDHLDGPTHMPIRCAVRSITIQEPLMESMQQTGTYIESLAPVVLTCSAEWDHADGVLDLLLPHGQSLRYFHFSVQCFRIAAITEADCAEWLVARAPSLGALRLTGLKISFVPRSICFSREDTRLTIVKALFAHSPSLKYVGLRSCDLISYPAHELVAWYHVQRGPDGAVSVDRLSLIEGDATEASLLRLRAA